MRIQSISLSLVLVAAMASVAYAAPIVNSTGLASPATTITFNEVILVPGTPLTTQYSAFGVTFSGLFYTPQFGTFPGVTGNDAGNFDPTISTVNNPFSILVVSDQTSAAFGLATNPAQTTLTALLDGSVVESFTQATTFNNPATAFVGFTGIIFDEIRVSVAGGGDLGLIDNIQFATAAVPEPGALTLVTFGLLALGRALWRRGED